MADKYYHTKATVDEYIKAAEGFNGKHLIDKLKDYLPLGSSVLELGSGPGTDWEILNMDFAVIGSDLSTEFLGRLKAKFPNDEFLELDAVTLSTHNKFKCIYSNKVLQHLTDTDLKTSLARQAEVLTANGLVCHSFWKGDGNEEFKGMFVNYHQRHDLEQFFTTHFEILLMEEYAEFDEADSIFLIAKKN